MRRSVEGRIRELDIEACKYALAMIFRGVPFLVALRSAEDEQKKETKS